MTAQFIKNCTFRSAEMSQAEQELRERVLALAAAVDPFNAVRLARDYLAFIAGEDAMTPRQRIDIALEEAGVS